MKYKVTVVPNDTLIIVDGEPLQFSFPAPKNLHALQWVNGKGQKELTNNICIPLKGQSDYTHEVAVFVSYWRSEKERQEYEQLIQEQLTSEGEHEEELNTST